MNGNARYAMAPAREGRERVRRVGPDANEARWFDSWCVAPNDEAIPAAAAGCRAMSHPPPSPRPGADHTAVAVDTLVGGVHFPDDTPAGDVGYKALAVNLSDLAAMGADATEAGRNRFAPGTSRCSVARRVPGGVRIARPRTRGRRRRHRHRGPAHSR